MISQYYATHHLYCLYSEHPLLKTFFVYRKIVFFRNKPETLDFNLWFQGNKSKFLSGYIFESSENVKTVGACITYQLLFTIDSAFGHFRFPVWRLQRDSHKAIYYAMRFIRDKCFVGDF